MELPYPDLLEVQAPTALPPSGGRGSAHAENFRYGQIENGQLRPHRVFRRGANRSVRRPETGGPGRSRVTLFETLATVTVTDLRIGDSTSHVLTVGKIVGQLTSSRTSDEDTPIQHVESRIERLQIDGQDVPLDLHDGLLKCPTFSSLVEQSYQGFRPPVLDHKGEPLRWTPPAGWKKGDPVSGRPPPHVGLQGTAGGEVPPGRPPRRMPDRGRENRKKWVITLGDLEITPHSRRLTMLRVDMEPNQKGTLVAAVVEGDGRPPP